MVILKYHIFHDKMEIPLNYLVKSDFSFRYRLQCIFFKPRKDNLEYLNGWETQVQWFSIWGPLESLFNCQQLRFDPFL